jgi:hypothetical protein
MTKGGETVMRKQLVALLIAAPAVGGLCWAPAASADVSTTQHLPAAACNSGTQNAHESVPENTGTGVTVPAHAAIPGTANVTPCGHGG